MMWRFLLFCSGFYLSSNAASAETVILRYGSHSDFGRVVLEWEQPIAYKLDQQGERATLTFPRLAEIEPGQLKQKPPKGITALTVQAGDGSTVIGIALQTKTELKVSSIGGRKIVLDAKPVTLSPAQNDLKSNSPVEKLKPTEPTSKPPSPQKSTKLAQSEVNSEKPIAVPDHLLKEDRRRSDLLIVSKETADGVNRLRFAWMEPVAAAVSLRANILWVAFDQAKGTDLSAIGSPSTGPVRQVEQIPMTNSTVLRFTIDPTFSPVLLRREAEWLIELRANDKEVLMQPMEPRIEAIKGAGFRIVAPIPDIGRPIYLKDPEVGDQLILLPTSRLGAGLQLPRQYPQMQFFASAQGLAVALRDEQIRVELTPEGAIFTTPTGLLLADDAANKKSNLTLKVEDWRGPQGNFTVLAHEKLAALSLGNGEESAEARLNLARFYFANKMPAEALGVLTRLNKANPKVFEDKANKLLRGAAAVLVQRPKDAEQDLGDASLLLDGEAALWRGRLALLKKHASEARDEFIIGRKVLTNYPPDWRGAMLLDIADAELRGGDVKAAMQVLKMASQEPLEQKDAAKLALLNGRAENQNGNRNGAQTHYQNAIASDVRPIAALATFEMTQLDLEAGKITPAQAIERYERLRYAWRGDQLEVDALRKLGALYMMEGQVRDGLASYRSAIALRPNTPEAKEMALEMNNGFAKLFLEGRAEKLSAVEALGLFYDFRELVPTGIEGDRMIARLTERLLQLDLLARAADLMEHRINRLGIEDKGRAALDLAAVRLKDRQPQLALKALQISAKNPLPADLQSERRLLEARALLEMDKADEALKIISVDQSAPALALRAEIHWRRKDWPAAVTALSGLLKPMENTSGPLSPVDRQIALQLAVALSFAKDDAGADRLAGAMTSRFEGSPELPIFKVLTARVNRNETEFRELASKVAGVGNLDAFLSAYRDRQQKSLTQGGSKQGT